MGDKKSEEKELPTEESIKVICRFRPLNDSEEKTGSKFIVKFPSGPEDNIVSIAVRRDKAELMKNYSHFVSPKPFIYRYRVGIHIGL